MIYLYNTLTRQEDEFKPIQEGKAGLYACGPTVYHDVSIGNFRTFIFTDILRRVLEYNGLEVKHVMNITDVGHLTDDGDEGEDKMIVAMKREGKTAWEIAEFYTERFLKGMKQLNLLPPHVMPRATNHIEAQINMVKALEEKGFTYQISDGIYFDTSKLADYGKLMGQKQEEKEAGARVEVNGQKRNAADFALWKFSPEGEKRHMEWESPWGTGFPGWHIECSAMSEQYLGSPFDIHTGGEDLAPVHHTNEIAQTAGSHGHDPVNIWMHGSFLQVDGGKMSKSLGNVYTIDDLVKKGYDPLAFRYLVLGAHYRTKLNFTFESLDASQNALHKLQDIVRNWEKPSASGCIEYEKRFSEAINNDLNTPKALAVVWEMADDTNCPSSDKAFSLLKFDKVLGLRLDNYISHPLIVPEEVKMLVDKREEARAKKDWEESDRLRNEIAEQGFIIEDTPEGPKLRKKQD